MVIPKIHPAIILTVVIINLSLSILVGENIVEAIMGIFASFGILVCLLSFLEWIDPEQNDN